MAQGDTVNARLHLFLPGSVEANLEAALGRRGVISADVRVEVVEQLFADRAGHDASDPSAAR